MEQENSFKEQMNEAFIEKYLIIWEQKAPHSSELESYIKGREELNLIETGEGCGNYKIWWTLANDYQFYAMEYERQTQNQQAIFYYYTKSIYCCMEALKYSMPDEEAEIIYNYMLIRYKDISRIEVCVPEKYKIRARDILDKFKELSNVQW